MSQYLSGSFVSTIFFDQMISVTVTLAHCHCLSQSPVAVDYHCECHFVYCDDRSMWTGAGKWERGDMTMEHGDGSVQIGQ